MMRLAAFTFALLVPLAAAAEDTGASVGTPGSVQVVSVTKAPPNDGTVLKSAHGDWEVRCSTNAGKEHCVLIQSVIAREPKNAGVSVIIFKGAGENPRLMRVIAPSGVLLPTGLGLSVDQGDVGRTGFIRCPPNGCIAEVALDDALLARLKKGNTATFIFFLTPSEGIGVPVSLKGFSKGFDALP